MIKISVLSVEYVRARVRAKEAGAIVNPTSDAVSLAFMAAGVNPTGGDWHAATWETTPTSYYARCLIGPGNVIVGLGTWDVWVKITDSPEVPVIRLDETLRIY